MDYHPIPASLTAGAAPHHRVALCLARQSPPNGFPYNLVGLSVSVKRIAQNVTEYF